MVRRNDKARSERALSERFERDSKRLSIWRSGGLITWNVSIWSIRFYRCSGFAGVHVGVHGRCCWPGVV